MSQLFCVALFRNRHFNLFNARVQKLQDNLPLLCSKDSSYWIWAECQHRKWYSQNLGFIIAFKYRNWPKLIEILESWSKFCHFEFWPKICHFSHLKQFFNYRFLYFRVFTGRTRFFGTACKIILQVEKLEIRKISGLAWPLPSPLISQLMSWK